MSTDFASFFHCENLLDANLRSPVTIALASSDHVVASSIENDGHDASNNDFIENNIILSSARSNFVTKDDDDESKGLADRNQTYNRTDITRPINLSASFSLSSDTSIQHIPKSTIHQLVAGQAITDLSSAVKELVDNAIDAGATRVCVKLINQGLEAIEVSDNGTGVPKDCRPFMAKKNATSKLRVFEDLYNCTTNSSIVELNMDNLENDDGNCTMNESDSIHTKSYQSNNRNGESAYATTHHRELSPSTSLGFRGEALFSLANVSRSLVVSTRTHDESGDDCEEIVPQEELSINNIRRRSSNSSLGQQFAFDRQGHLIHSSLRPTARSVGTTVTIYGLFEALPVRRVDLCKRVKGQMMKLIKVMQGYAILCLGTQFNLVDVHTSLKTSKIKCKSKSDVRLATSESSNTLESRTASVLGTKFLSGLTRIKVDLQSAVVQDSSSSPSNKKCQWKMEGLISHAPSSLHPSSARDLQFFSVNGRPVDLPTVSRTIGDIWRLFDPGSALSNGNTGRRRPACILAFSLPNNMFDVNLSPDKREVMFTEETAILALIREGLMTLWTGESEGHFTANEVESRNKIDSGRGSFIKTLQKESNFGSSNHGPIKSELDDKNCNTVSPLKVWNKATFPASPPMESSDISKGNVITPLESMNSLKLVKSEDEATKVRGKDADEQFDTSHQVSEASTHSKSLNGIRVNRVETVNKIHDTPVLSAASIAENDLQGESNNTSHSMVGGATSEMLRSIARIEPCDTTRQASRIQRQMPHGNSFLESFRYVSSKSDDMTGKDVDDFHVTPSDAVTEEEMVNVQVKRRMFEGERIISQKQSQRKVEKTLSNDRSTPEITNTVIANEKKLSRSKLTSISADTVWDNFSGTQSIIGSANHAQMVLRKNRDLLRSSFKRKREDSMDSKISNKKSTINLSKEEIVHMSVIGQFNLGFILAMCRNHNLWILDQHACDEKYNFERLCKETILHEQKLIAPLPLELSPSEEHCILEHMDIFEKNGFRFTYCPEKEPRYRLSLTALPHSGSGRDGKKAVQFGKEDVGALCAMLGADGASSSEGCLAGFGSGADGSGTTGNNAVRRYAGIITGNESGKVEGILGSSIVRLPKAIAMFASRACRGSIMIGTALSLKDQKNILKKLDKTDIPWNCAHGRPTMCHIRNLTQCLLDDEDVQAALFTFGSNSYSLTSQG